MDSPWFESVARSLAARMSRRRAVGTVAGSFIAAAGGERLVAAQDATPAPSSVATPVSDALAVRRNGKDFSADERRAFVDALLATKKKPSSWAPGLSVYDTFVLWHRDAYDCALMAAHMGPAFFPWHRQFLRMFEQELQAIEPTVTLPYWDWTVDNTADAYLWDDDFLGGNGDPAEGYAVMTGPFRKGDWEIAIFDYTDAVRTPFIVRDFGAMPSAPALPTPDDLETALRIPTYDAAPWNTLAPNASSFRNSLEGWHDCVEELCDPDGGMYPVCTGPHTLHNQVHLWVAGEFAFAAEGAREGRRGHEVVVEATPSPETDRFGTMAANSSPNDPVFWMHHTNVDRIWSEWMRRHGPSYLPETGGPVGHNLDDPMWPYSHLGMTVTPRMMLSTRDLGYVYDTEL